jgi:hypothetical protein
VLCACARLASAEQESRAINAERARLIAGLQDLQALHGALEAENQQLNQQLQAARAEIERLTTGGSPASPSRSLSSVLRPAPLA